MVMRRKSRNLNLKTPVSIYVLAGAGSVVLAAAVVFLCTRPVHADARVLPAPTTQAAASPVNAATPETLAAANAQPASQPAKATRGNLLRGFASWYGGIFNGQKTASGETFDMYAMTACHPTLPFGSIVRVINRRNHRSVVVRITDRSDLIKGRIIDLSYGAAEKLAMIDAGVAPVQLQVLQWGRKNGNNDQPSVTSGQSGR